MFTKFGVGCAVYPHVFFNSVRRINDMADARVLCGGSDRTQIIVNFYTIVGVYSLFGNCAAFKKIPTFTYRFQFQHGTECVIISYICQGQFYYICVSRALVVLLYG